MLRDVLRFFPHDGVYEVILSTRGEVLNASPIGIRKEGNSLYALVYRSTATFLNLSKDKRCGLTISHNAEKFFKALKGELNEIVALTDDGYPYLPGDVVVIADCVVVDDKDPAKVDVVPRRIVQDYKGEDLFAFSRADSLFIDALVHLTRIDIEPRDQREILVRLILYELAMVKRLKPSLGSAVDEVVSKLIKAFKP